MLRQLTASPVVRRLCLNALDQSSTSISFCASGATASLITPASISPIQQLIKLMPLSQTYSTASAAAANRTTAATAPEPVFQDLSSLPPLTLAEHNLQGEYRDVEVPLYDINKEPIGKFILDGDIFDVPIRRDILHRVVRWQLARRQQGTHKTKTRSEVRGGGRKPWNQKGSGRARQGTIRAPQWRGGGVAHGPVPRTHEHDLQKRVRRLGLKCALSAKAWERRVIVVDSLRPGDFKTKTMDGHVEKLLQGAARRSVLLVDSDKDGLDGGDSLRLGIANLPWVDILPSVGLNVYSLLQRDYLVITRDAVESLVGRLRKPIKPCSITP